MSINKLKEGYSVFRAEDCLTDEEAREAFLSASLENADDPADIVKALRVVARARNKTELAHETGMSRDGLRRAISQTGNPTLATVCRMAKALGFRLKIEAIPKQ